MKKTSQFKKVCKDDSHELAELKQQKSKRLILLRSDTDVMAMCCKSNISLFDFCCFSSASSCLSSLHTFLNC